MIGDLSTIIVPPGGFRTIVADPPWPEKGKGMFRPDPLGRMRCESWDYPLMTMGEISQMQVGSLAASCAHLYLIHGAILRQRNVVGHENDSRCGRGDESENC